MAPAERSLSLRRSSRARGGKEYVECGQILLIVPRQTRREPDQAPHANFHRGGCQAEDRKSVVQGTGVHLRRRGRLITKRRAAAGSLTGTGKKTAAGAAPTRHGPVPPAG